MYTIYCIKQSDNVLYVGKTKNFQRRVWEHRYRRKLDHTYTFEKIVETDSKQQAKILEEKYIASFGTFKNGWNKTLGEGAKGVPNTPNDGRFKKGNSVAQLREKKKVLHVEIGVVYESVKECAELEGLNISSLYKACNGQNKTCKKHHYQYA